MHAAQVVFFVSCALHQVSTREEFHLCVVNNTSTDFFEFRIRASGLHREWTSVRLDVGDTGSIRLASADPFDVELWRWRGDGQWIVSRQSGVYFKNHDDGLNLVRMERTLTNFVAGTPDSDYGFEYAALATRNVGKKRKLVEWRLEQNPFRLIVPREESRY